LSEELQIPYGVDSHGTWVYIEQAIRGPYRYSCPECGGPLECREGEKLKYFCHHRGIGPQDCGLRTQQDWDNFAKVNPVERRERKGRLWLGVETNPYDDSLRLVGLFRRPSWDDFGDDASTEVQKMIDSMNITGSGMLGKPNPSKFHPSEQDEFVTVELDPDASEFQLTVSANFAPPSIGGVWKSSAVIEGDIFVGSDRRARKLESVSSIDFGEILYLVRSRIPTSIPPSASKYHLGRYAVIGIEITDESLKWISRQFPDTNLPDLKRGENTFSVDIIMPRHVNPRELLSVGGLPQTRAMIAILPAGGLDPEIEISRIPSSSDKPTTIPPSGMGKTRIFRPQFPEQGSYWLAIHCLWHHKVIRVYSASKQPDGLSGNLLGSQIGVRLRRPGDNDFRFLHPWEVGSPVELSSGSAVSETLQVLAPPGMMVSIRGLFIDNGDTRIAVDTVNDPVKLMDRVEDWIEEKCSQIEIDFGVLGLLSIRIPESDTDLVTEEPEKPVEFKITDEEIVSGLLGFEGGLPKKANWEAVRTVLRLPPGTKHHLVQSGTKTRIRNHLSRLRERKDGNH